MAPPNPMVCRYPLSNVHFRETARNPFRIRSFETKHLKPFRIRIYEKTPGGGASSLSLPPFASSAIIDGLTNAAISASVAQRGYPRSHDAA
jgi:hypothetical protein